MKKILSSFLPLLLATPLLAQRDIPLPGLVVRQNSRIKTGQVEYLSKVSIQATQAAAPTMSDATGSFTLVFADKPAYNVTRIFAEKNGMEVVNKTDLERAAVIGRLDKLKIVMCPSGELMESQMQYYGIAQEAIVSRFKKRIAALEDKNANLDKLIAEINEEYNLQLNTKNEAIYALEKEWSEALAFAQETAEKFAAINLDDADSLYLQADAAFKKGDFTRVLQLLQYDLLDKNLRNIRSNLSAADSLSAEGRARIARGQENLRQTIQNALFAARVAKFDGAWKRAEAYYDLAVRGDEGDGEVIFEVANFMLKQNYFDKSLAYYNRILTLAKEPDQRASVLLNRSVLLITNNMVTEATEGCKEAVSLYNSLYDNYPDDYSRSYILTLNSLGTLFYKNNDVENAKKYFEMSLKIVEQRNISTDSTAYLLALGVLQNGLGFVYLYEKNVALSLKHFNKSIETFKIGLKEDAELFQPYLAISLMNAGLVFYNNSQFEVAEKKFQESLLIHRDISKKNPDAYLPELAKILVNLANLYTSTNRHGIAKEYCNEAIQIYEILLNKNPYRYSQEMSTALYNMGYLLSRQNQRQEAHKMFTHSEKICRELVILNEDMYLPDLARVLNSKGVTLSNTAIDSSLKYYEESLHIYKKLADKNPRSYTNEIVSVLGNIGSLYKNKDFILSKKYYDEALFILRNISNDSSRINAPNIAKTLFNLGVLHHIHKDYSASYKNYSESKRIYETLVVNGKAYYPELAVILSCMGSLLSDQSETSSAIKSFALSLNLYTAIVEENPDLYLQSICEILNKILIMSKNNQNVEDLSRVHDEIVNLLKIMIGKTSNKNSKDLIALSVGFAMLLKDNNDLLSAQSILQEALQMSKKLSEENPNVYLPFVAGNLNDLGLLAIENKNIAEARKFFEDALTIYKTIPDKNTILLQSMANSLNNLGNLLRNNNYADEAKKPYEEALQIHKKLAEKDPQLHNPDVVMMEINIGLLYVQLLNATGDMPLKKEGLNLMKDAEQRLDILIKNDSKVHQYQRDIINLTGFFNRFNESLFQYGQQIGHLNSLEKQFEMETNPYKKAMKQEEIINILLKHEKAMPDNLELKKIVTNKYGSLAWYQLFTKQFPEAEKSARIGLERDPTVEWINTNLALALLYQGKWEAAKEIYENLKDKPYGEGTYKATFLEDLDALEKEGITHPDVAKVRNLLGNK